MEFSPQQYVMLVTLQISFHFLPQIQSILNQFHLRFSLEFFTFTIDIISCLTAADFIYSPQLHLLSSILCLIPPLQISMHLFPSQFSLRDNCNDEYRPLNTQMLFQSSLYDHFKNRIHNCLLQLNDPDNFFNIWDTFIPIVFIRVHTHSRNVQNTLVATKSTIKIQYLHLNFSWS